MSFNRLSNKQHNKIATLLRQGGLGPALEMLNDVCKVDPDNIDAWTYKGDIAYSQQDMASAIQCFNQVIQLDRNNINTLNKLAVCYFNTQQYDLAINYYSKIIHLQPGNAIALNNLGILLQLKNQLDQAAEMFRKAISIKSDYLDAAKNLCIYLENRQNQTDQNELITVARNILPYTGNASWFDNILGKALQRTGDAQGAIQAYQQGLLKNPNDISILNNLGTLYFNLQAYDAAVEYFKNAFEADSESSQTCFNIGLTYQKAGDIDAATDYFRKACMLDNLNIEYQFNLGNSLLLQGELPEAETILTRITDAHPEHSRAVAALINIYNITKRKDKGIQLLKQQQQFYKQTPLPPVLLHKSIEYCEVTDDCARAISDAEQLLNNSSCSDADKIRLHFALGKYFDLHVDYDSAFRHFKKGNDLHKPSAELHRLELRELKNIINLFDKNTFDNIPCSRNESECPVFIVGMPRSGTSLTEQIICSHSQAFGAGELPTIQHTLAQFVQKSAKQKTFPECLFSLTTDSLTRQSDSYLAEINRISVGSHYSRITDKMPSNFKFLLYIEKLFPHARIIHCRRDPLDTCLSIYSFTFTGLHNYAYDLKMLGEYYQQYEKVMAHQKSILNIPIMDIQYESLVSDPEKYSKQLIEFCGLKWDPVCLEFYNTRRHVRTASQQQVNQPLYKSSIERWKNYEKHLAPLIEALKDQ